jgi:excisionase family DNA binding protein
MSQPRPESDSTANSEETDVPGAVRETLTIDEASQRLGVSVKVTRKAAKAGEIPAIRIGRRLLVLRAPFEELLRSRHLPPRKRGIS